MLWESCSYSYIEHNKIGFAIFGIFYYFISNLQDTAKTLKGVKNHFARRESSHLCPQPSPPYPDGGGALAGGEVRLGEANKRARSAIGLTRDRLAAEARPEDVTGERRRQSSGGAAAEAQILVRIGM
jgi:hypothetical protein